MGIEPTCLAWKASVLPLNYTRKFAVWTAKRIITCRKNIVNMDFTSPAKFGVTGLEPAAS